MVETDILNITKIKDGFFLGDEKTSSNQQAIDLFKISHIINAAGPDVQNCWEAHGIKYLTLNWNESKQQNLFDPKDEIANRIVGFIDDSDKNGEGFLVHSVRGENRACLVVLIYCIRKLRWSMKKSLEFLASKKSDIDIPGYFLTQLNNYEARLCSIGQGPKTHSWSELSSNIGTGSDVNNEEVLLRNTFVNSLASKFEKPVGVSKLSNKGIIWGDRSEQRNLISNSFKKDLLLQRDIKPLVYNKNTKPPKKGCLKVGSSMNKSPSVSKTTSNNNLVNLSNNVGSGIGMNLNSQTPITTTNFQNFIANNKNNNNLPLRISEDLNNVNNFSDKDKDKNIISYVDQLKMKKLGSNNFIDDMSTNIKPISFINNPNDLLNEGYHQLNPNMPHNHGFLRENSIKKKQLKDNNNSLKHNKTQINSNTINNNSELRSLGLYDNNQDKEINKNNNPQKIVTTFLNNNNNNNFNSTSKFGVSSNVYPVPSNHNSNNFDIPGYNDNVNKIASELNNKNMFYTNNDNVSRLNSFTSNQSRSTNTNNNTNVKQNVTNTSSYRPSSADSKTRGSLNTTNSTNPNNIVINNQFSTTVNNNINNIYIQQTPEELRRIIAISSEKQPKDGVNNINNLNKNNLIGNSNSTNTHMTATFGKSNQYPNNFDLNNNGNLIRPGNMNENNINRIDKNNDTQRILKNNYFNNNNNNFIQNNNISPIMNINVIKKGDEYTNNNTFKTGYSNFKTPSFNNDVKNNTLKNPNYVNNMNNLNSITNVPAKRNNTGDITKKNVSLFI